MASFSRLQLAAALIDNDPSDPTKPFRSAHESARRKSVDYLSIDLPGGHATGSKTESVQGLSRTPSSADMLRNPFGRDTIFSDGAPEEGEDEMEVDLSSWGLDSFIPKEKGDRRKSAKGKEKVAALPNPHPATHVAPYLSGRSQSMGNLDSFGAGGAFLDSPTTETRPRSLSAAVDLGEYQSYRPPRHQRPSSTHDAIDRLPVTPPLHSIPFPVQSVRSASPGPIDGMGSKGLLAEAEELPNPFELEPPSPDQASRFDPKARARTMSMGTMGSLGSQISLQRKLPIPLRDLYPNTWTRTRTLSNASMLRDNDAVLVMPSPLQSQSQAVAAPSSMSREGFEISTDGPPLPQGARSDSNRRLSTGTLLANPPDSAVPIASNSFTPNPRANLTLSQLTFRNTLMVGGQRDVAYTDIDTGLRRALEDGEQVVDELLQEEPARPVSVIVEEPRNAERPPGKLYGRSLVDELESRKATRRSKQRVFTGDNRPSMMARGQMQRSSTLIDPASLDQRPVSQNLMASETRPNLARSGSFRLRPSQSGVRNARSVFGVDTLWEREMEKLKQIEAEEAEEQRKQEAIEAARLEKKSKKKKRKEKPTPLDIPVEQPTVCIETPTPRVQRTIERRVPPPPNDDETESSGESSDGRAPRPPPEVSAEGWHSGESDKELNGPVRTTGVGPRYPNRARRPAPFAHSATQSVEDDDSEEDIPLAATVSRAVQRATRLGPGDEDEDEDEDDKPLGLRASRFMSSQSQLGHAAGEDDDDLPLAFHPEQQRPTQMILQAQVHQSMMFSPPSLMGSGFFGAPVLPQMIPPFGPPPAPPSAAPDAADMTKFGRVDRWRREIVEGGQP
ncbi:hypothetical protein BGW80DRAFT_1435453 [Lactifluus volemus]|nr:hypothetical protein BGW80DRAFT_1435453 [Lactifluus volemus]